MVNQAGIRKDFFLSYSRADTDFAEKIAMKLEEQGYTVWIDRTNIEASVNFQEEITSAIDQCRYCIVILTKASAVESRYVSLEVTYAYSRNKRIFPLLREDTDIPFILLLTQQIDFRDDKVFAKNFQKLLQSIRYVEKNPAPVGKANIANNRLGNAPRNVRFVLASAILLALLAILLTVSISTYNAQQQRIVYDKETAVAFTATTKSVQTLISQQHAAATAFTQQTATVGVQLTATAQILQPYIEKKVGVCGSNQQHWFTSNTLSYQCIDIGTKIMYSPNGTSNAVLTFSGVQGTLPPHYDVAFTVAQMNADFTYLILSTDGTHKYNLELDQYTLNSGVWLATEGKTFVTIVSQGSFNFQMPFTIELVCKADEEVFQINGNILVKVPLSSNQCSNGITFTLGKNGNQTQTFATISSFSLVPIP